MLHELKISKFAIIENLAVEFHPGLNILTGETGAGKSIILSALNLILGGRADTDSIRSGETAATVEASLQVTDPKTLQLIESQGFEVEDGRVFIKRTITSNGKNRAYLNNSSITVAALSEIGNRLIDIHGQHDHQSLLHPETHVDMLDAYGQLADEKNRFAGQFAAVQKQQLELKKIVSTQSARLQRQDLLNFQVSEIDQAQLTVGEDDILLNERNKLRHAEKLHQAVDRALQILRDAEDSLLERLGALNNELTPLPEIDATLEDPLKRGQTAYYELEELASELQDYLRTVEFQPARLEEIEDRLAEINGLKRKYGVDLPAVLAYREKIGEELNALTFGEEAAQALRKEIQDAEKILSKDAVALAEKREAVAERMKKNVEKELRDLNMKDVQFGVRFNYDADPDGFTMFRKAKVVTHANGIGAIEFLFSPNPGESLRPLAKIASGGELSRVMLALKSILNEQDGVPVMVFDEVDSGISGKVADQVGIKLKKIAADKQVFCITHLPQIAGRGGAHYRVHKTVSGKRTRATITLLNYEERVKEIARLSGGEKITATTLKYAKEMIK